MNSRPKCHHPILVIRSSAFARDHVDAIVIMIVASGIQLTRTPNGMLLPRTVSNLPGSSITGISRVLAISGAFLIRQVNTLPSSLHRRVSRNLQAVLCL